MRKMLKPQWRVHVEGAHGIAHVRLVRWRWATIAYITVGKVNLTTADVDERLAEIRMRARSMADELNGLERP